MIFDLEVFDIIVFLIDEVGFLMKVMGLMVENVEVDYRQVCFFFCKKFEVIVVSDVFDDDCFLVEVS